MAKSRPTMRCRIDVEGLEARRVLSSVAGVAPTHAAEVSALAANKDVRGTLKGAVTSEAGQFYVYNGVVAKIGKARFSGGGLAERSGSRITGGEFHLGNAEGTFNLEFFGGQLKPASKKTMTTKVVFIVQDATGKYAPADGIAGNLNLIIPDTSVVSRAPNPFVITSGAGEILSN